jgi:hypothetical protein
VAPVASEAQPAGKKLPRVVLVFSTMPVAEMLGPDPMDPGARAFVHTLRDRGWIDGHTVVIERRSAEAKWDQVSAQFTDAARQEPDVLITTSLRMVRAARAAPMTIPIVMFMSDPVGRGMAHGIGYAVTSWTKSQLYGEMLPLLTSHLQPTSRGGGGPGSSTSRA